MGTPSERLPLGGKAYGSIGHLPGSHTGAGDHHVNPGQAALFTSSPRPNHELFVQEKLDGSCVCAARIGDQIFALGRNGSLASRSPNEGRRLWARWVHDHQDRFLAVLRDGERLVGEWLALVHGTRYQLRHDPFVPFDLMRGPERTPWDAFIDPPEGAVWRLERTVKRQRQVLLVAKFVRSDKVDGAYLPEITGRPALWNWRPD